MVFINSKLGNGFRINSVDSSKNQDHYFSGAPSFVRYKIHSASSVNGTTLLTDQNKGFGMQFGSDINNVLFDEVQARNFIGSLTASVPRFGGKLVINYESKPALSSGIGSILYEDNNSTEYIDSVDITGLGNLIYNGLTSDKLSGSYSWSFNIKDGNTTFAFPPNVSDPEVFLAFTASSDVDVVRFRDIRIEFDQNLTDFGVEKYKEIDNQNTEILNINRNLMPVVPDNIREKSYYGWQNILEAEPTTTINSYFFNDVAIDSSGSLYVVGRESNPTQSTNWIVFKSLLSENRLFYVVDYFDRDSGADEALGVAIDSDDNVYVVGKEFVTGENVNWVVRRSTTGESGSFTYVDSFNRDNGADIAHDVAITTDGTVYVVGEESVSGQNSNWIIRSSVTGASGTFGYVDSVNVNNGDDIAYGVDVNSNGNVFVAGQEQSSITYDWVVRSSATGASGTFDYVDHFNRASDDDVAYGVTVDSNDNVYVVGQEIVGGTPNMIVRKSTDGSSGSFDYIDSVSDNTQGRGVSTDSDGNVYVVGQKAISAQKNIWIVRKSTDGSSGSFSYIDEVDDGSIGFSEAYGIEVDSYKKIYVVGRINSKVGVLRAGQLTSNSASLGPRTLATSIGYVDLEISGSAMENFKLGNISEFPHSSGLFQMPNMVLGTVDTGTIGNTEENIIQVNYFGSVVRVLWPKQSDQNLVVDGFGDSAAGQRSGKLEKQFTFGQFMNVTEFDHLTLYAYLLKNLSGTLDNVDIKIERRPLRSVGFTTDQTITYTTSGSDTVAELKDVIYRKQIDYGDLSIREIGYPIDIPLTNVREIRVSARQVTGQSEDSNRNLIVWGRLISSDKET